jgi:glycosidase
MLKGLYQLKTTIRTVLAIVAIIFVIVIKYALEVEKSTTTEVSTKPLIAVENTQNDLKNTSKKSIELIHSTHKPWQNAITYQVWVRSFYDSDGDGTGDLAGLTAKLPYLNDLGIDTLWLSPIFESPSYHGYDTSNFYKIDPDVGTMVDYEQLISAAKALNIRIILDISLNHVSEYHPWFQKSLAQDSIYDNYFVWSKELPAGYGRAWGEKEDPTAVWHKKEERDAWYYGVFGWTQPDLNFKNEAVVEEVKKIATFWLAKGADGFRLDAVRYMVEEGGLGKQADTTATHQFWKDFTAHVRDINPEVFLVGEAFNNTRAIAKYYQNGKGFDSTFDFSYGNIVANSLDYSAINQEEDYDKKNRAKQTNLDGLWNVFQERAYAKVPASFYGTFLSGHDSDRLAGGFNGDIAKAKIAASLLLTGPYMPYIYYGEEIGMQQKAGSEDVYRRAIMQWDDSESAGFSQSNELWLDNGEYFYWLEDFAPWWKDYWQDLPNRASQNVAAQLSQADSLFTHYKKLISLRKNSPILQRPDAIHLVENFTHVWLVQYTQGENSQWVIINLDTEQDTIVELPSELNGDFTDHMTDNIITLENQYGLLPGETLILSKVIVQ